MRGPRRDGLAHVVLSLDPGGTEKLVIDLARRCSRRLGTFIYCLDRAGEWATQPAAEGIQVRVADRRPGFDRRLPFQLADFVAQDNVRVLHCHQYSPFVYGGLARVARRDLRIVFTEHGRLSAAPPSRKRRLANAFLAPLANVITAVSEELRDFMVLEGFRRDRIQVVHNGIDPGSEPRRAEHIAAREALGVDASAFVIVTAARLDPVKNLRMAIDAFGRVAADNRSALLVIVGDGPDRGELEQRAAAQNLNDRIRWLGYRPDARRLLAGADVYVNTSVYEGISVTILEAMAAGIPVVATRVGGTPEVVAHGVSGLLVASDDVTGFAGALRSLIDGADLRARIGHAARARVESAFTMDRMVSEYLQAYEVG
jgi:glycosyltransferase involved in cell wall biosynthesis